VIGEWRKDAACYGHDPELWLPPEREGSHGSSPTNGLRIGAHVCREHCTVRAQCLEWAEREVAERDLWPCVAGGVRWTTAKHSNGRARVSVPITPSDKGCPICDIPLPQRVNAIRKRRALLASDPTLAPHGVRTTYVHWGCRCGPCRAANNAYQLAQSHKAAG
jgi:hypothetical protein